MIIGIIVCGDLFKLYINYGYFVDIVLLLFKRWWYIFLFLVKVNKCNLIDKIGWLRNEL